IREGIPYFYTIQKSFMHLHKIFYALQLLAKSDTKIVAAANGETALMLHTVRPIKGGIELRSRFWLGWNVDLQTHEPIRVIPDDAKIDGEIAKRLGIHSIKEMTNLAKILPSIYRENKDNF
ncbi:DAPG hydrolase family protein, partial [Levilactobacillus yiduensis]|uniref:DAPG hydrolase family protein n=1 Tax=Levilactobacillus yiduensis TaxID=2953880 RepID=UPI002157ACB1